MIRIISDVHAANHEAFGGMWKDGLNVRAAKIIDAVKRATKSLEKGDTLIIAGDLFDTRKPDPAVAWAISELLAQLMEQRVFVTILLGNHELQDSHGSGDNALRYLERTRAQILYETTYDELEGFRFLFVPFRRGNAENFIQKESDSYKDSAINFVIGHYGIAPKESPLWMREAEDYISEALLLKLFPESTVLFGHHHVRSKYSNGKLMQIGSLCPVGFGDKGPNGFGTILDITNGEVSFREDKGVRFIELINMNILEDLPAALPYGAFLRLPEPPEEKVAAKLEEGGFSWKIIPRKKTEDRAIKQASQSSVKPDSDFVVASIKEYINTMPNQKDLSKDKLNERAKALWEKAQNSA